MKKLLLLSSMMLLSLVTSASDFEKEGIEYTIKSVSEKTVYVSKINLGGDIVIPEKVLYNDYWFTVDSLGSLYGSNQTTSIKINKFINTNGKILYANGTACYYVDESNPYMKAVDGVLYSKDMTRLISFPMYKNCDEFTIPESVTIIDDNSFGANQFIKRLIFSDNIEDLPENFLYGSGNNGKLKYLKLSDKIKVIHGNTLYSFYSLEELVLPRDLEEVEKDKYWGHYGLPTELSTITISNSKIANYVYALEPSIYVFSRFYQLKNLYVKDSNPVALDNNVFTEGQFFTINLYVPKGTKETYKNTEGWKNFFNIIEEGEQEQKEKCAYPIIHYSNGKLSFNCETDGVEYVTNITDSDIKQHYGATIQLSATYNISVYATKAGYDNSETATATLCWIDVEPKTEGISNGVTEVRARAALIKSAGGQLTIEGIDDGQLVELYSLNGEKRGSAVGKNGVAQINTNLKAGNIAVIKINNKSVKITIK